MLLIDINYYNLNMDGHFLLNDWFEFIIQLTELNVMKHRS